MQGIQPAPSTTVIYLHQIVRHVQAHPLRCLEQLAPVFRRGQFTSADKIDVLVQHVDRVTSVGDLTDPDLALAYARDHARLNLVFTSRGREVCTVEIPVWLWSGTRDMLCVGFVLDVLDSKSPAK
jgi:hypothetical protein